MSLVVARTRPLGISALMTAFEATADQICSDRVLRFVTDTVEKGILRGPLSNIDSRRASNEQDRFKNSFARIRLFQILIPQLHFGYFFNTIGQTRTSSLGAARPLPPSADIGPGGQSVGQAAQFCLATTLIVAARGRRAPRLP